MRLVTMRTPNGGTRAGILDGDEVAELPFPDAGAALAVTGGDPAADILRSRGARHPLDQVTLAPPVPRPAKVLCVGLNYAGHITEMGRDLPAYPTLFGKFARTLVGPRDEIVSPAVSDQVDWEVELGVVIGRPVRHATDAAARAAIAGYTVVNDVSVRDYQRRTLQFLQGKMFESTTPVGPAIVTLDELDDPDDLRVRCAVDDQVMQDGRTGDLLFGPVDLVRYVSEIITLEPGDLIATGTPAGVGAGRTPPVFLQPGQILRTWIDGVGELVNRCVKEPAPARD